MAANPFNSIAALAPTELSAYRRCTRKGWTAELNATPAEREEIKVNARADIKARLLEAIRTDQLELADELQLIWSRLK